MSEARVLQDRHRRVVPRYAAHAAAARRARAAQQDVRVAGFHAPAACAVRHVVSLRSGRARRLGRSSRLAALSRVENAYRKRNQLDVSEPVAEPVEEELHVPTPGEISGERVRARRARAAHFGDVNAL